MEDLINTLFSKENNLSSKRNRKYFETLFPYFSLNKVIRLVLSVQLLLLRLFCIPLLWRGQGEVNKVEMRLIELLHTYGMLLLREMPFLPIFHPYGMSLQSQILQSHISHHSTNKYFFTST